jgi:hydroxyethylthiazole kinase-like uncharacterized protein yjeF
MTELLTARQMRELEHTAIASGETTGLALMERAGQGVIDAILARWPQFRKKTRRALILCGPGNNGGDGFVMARLLKEMGWAIDLYLFGDPGKLPPDAAENHRLWSDIGAVGAWAPDAILAGARPDLIVDAVFGIGLTRPLPKTVARVLDRGRKVAWKRKHKIRTVAVDCPSGLNLDTGHIPSDANPDDPDFDPWTKTLNWADMTATFHSPKPGHYLAMGPVICGTLTVVDIGLRGPALERRLITQAPDPERARLVEGVFVGQKLRTAMWPMGEISKTRHQGHKFDHGHAVVFAGGTGKGGAARLAARGALRVGAGLVTVLCPPAALKENAARLDAIMLRPIKDVEAFHRFIDERIGAFCLGPGMGVSAGTREMVCAVLALERTTVLDADALTSFATQPQMLFDQLHEDCVLTPHFGEFERLFPDIAVQFRTGVVAPIDCLRAAARRAGAIVLLKGPSTIIAAPNGGASVHAAHYERQAPWLATAGAGDVLAGMIAGIAASDTRSGVFQAVEVAVWLHVEAARAFGPGLIAEDLPETLPKVFRTLLA